MTSSIVGKRYQLLTALGAGGMGAVYLALDRLAGETVALKRVSIPTYDDDDPTLAALMAGPDPALALAREFEALASLRHPNIIAVHDYGFDALEGASEPQPFFTMELLPSSVALLKAGYPLPFEGRANLWLQLLHALAYLHRRGFTHGDLKPENVLVTREGMVKVLDFGLALRAGQSLETTTGTRAYMAPELLKGQPASPASDLYAVGVMAYELFVGRPPFDRQSSQFEYDVMYTPVNVGGLGLPPALAQILGRLLAKTPAGRPADVHEVIRALSAAIGKPLPVETPATRESFLQAAELVGRDAELTQLTQALKLSHWGQGSAWLVGGESGVGKSRLLDELRTRALVQGALVLRGQAVSEGGLPYSLWRESLRWLALLADPDDLEAGALKPYVAHLDWLLERAVPDAPELDPRAAQTRLLATAVGLLRRVAAQQPILLLLEDLHWADANSLALLTWLTRVAPELRLLIVASYRDDERPRLPDELPGIRLLPLRRLSEKGVAALSAAMLGSAGKETALVDFLARETEGNAFFIVEVVRALAEEAGRLDLIAHTALPEHVAAGGMINVVQRRLSRVLPSDRPLLELAAIAGRQLDMTVLSAADLAIDLTAWLTRCADAAVLEPQAEGWRFAHNKFREGVLADLSADQRRALHRRVALALEAAYPKDAQQAPVLAHHWGTAGDPAKEAHYATLAGEQVLKAGNFREALQYFWRALAVFPEELERGSDNQHTRMTLLYWLGEAYERLGELREARDNFQNSLALARTSDHRKGMVDALAGLCWVATREGAFDEAHHLGEESLAWARAAGYHRGTALSLRRLGNMAALQSNHASAAGYFTESLAIAKKAGDRSMVGRCLNNLGDIATEQGDYALAAHYLNEALATMKEIGDQEGVAFVNLSLGDLAIGQNDWSAAQNYCQAGLKQAVSIAAMPWVLFALAGLADVQVKAKRYEAAAELLGLVLTHPASDAQVKQRAEPVLALARAALPPDVVEAALERGRAKESEAVVAEILS